VSDELRFMTPEGGSHAWEVAEAGAAPANGSLLAARRVIHVPTGTKLIRKCVPPALGRQRPEAYDLLENEIRIALRLLRRLGEGGYPAELARIVGYDADAEEPFVLFADYRGAPIGAQAGRMLQAEQRAALGGLFRAIDVLGVAGVVHGDVGPYNVFWDGGGVQLVTFEGAAVAGLDWYATPRRPPWAAPELRRPNAWPWPSADVWSASLLAYHLVTGRKVDGLSDAPDLSTTGDALRHWLRGAFATVPGERPSAAAVLDRLRVPRSAARPGEEYDALFRQGRQRFDEEFAARRGDDTLPPPPRPAWRRWAAAALLGALAAAALAMLILPQVVQ
jgi:hypothetical protein